jgi:ADP-L-glycero-D-manno-heptose 6-epimerase
MTQNSPLPILVTGAAGFIGARLVERLNSLGLPLISVDDLGAFQERAEHATLQFGKQWSIEQLDEILDREAREKTPPQFSAIFHLGAISDTTELDTEKLRIRNVLASQKLWNSASRNGIPFYYASSAATYGEGENGYDDDETRFSHLKPLNPYGESKRVFDLWVLSEEKQGNHPPSWAGFKFFNVYGFGERHKGKMASVVLHAFDQIHSRGFVKLFKSHREGISDGEQKRDFIFVEDVIDVLLFAWKKPIRRGVFNLGTGNARSFRELVESVFAALDRSPQIEFVDTPLALRERYQYFTQAEMARLRSEGYQTPFTPLEVGSAKTVNRLLQHGKGTHS